ncbi:hypothetical protein Mapa_006591 [Marchantia paleacea]|nr:hypothetical protein Mapa_006591 [Marchantia paleacea]
MSVQWGEKNSIETEHIDDLDVLFPHDVSTILPYSPGGYNTMTLRNLDMQSTILFTKGSTIQFAFCKAGSRHIYKHAVLRT